MRPYLGGSLAVYSASFHFPAPSSLLAPVAIQLCVMSSVCIQWNLLFFLLLLLLPLVPHWRENTVHHRPLPRRAMAHLVPICTPSDGWRDLSLSISSPYSGGPSQPRRSSSFLSASPFSNLLHRLHDPLDLISGATSRLQPKTSRTHIHSALLFYLTRTQLYSI